MINKFPIQKVPSNLKTKKWFRDCVIYGVDIVLNEDNSIKPDTSTILENYKIYNGERDMEGMKKTFDPMSALSEDFNPVFKTFSTISDRIDELVGEYIESGVEYVVAAIDRDAVNKKIQENKQRVTQGIMKIINDDSINSKEEIENKLEELVDFKFMSKAEVAANKVLNYYKKATRLKYKEIEGFRNALITAVVGFSVDIVNNRLDVTLYSSDEIYAVRNGYSNDLKDSEIIATVKYLPVGKIVDLYGEFLKDSDLKRLLNGNLSEFDTASTETRKTLTFKSKEEVRKFLKMDSSASDIPGTIIDNNGNIRVIKIKWLGFRKLYKRKYYDSNGVTQYDYVSEKYKADIDKGETLTARWFPEWHSGVLIGSDIVVDAKVEPYQYMDVKNPNINVPGFVGGYFNVGNQKAKSLIDKIKSYLYFRDMIFARIEDILSKNIGKAIELDLSRKPKSWNIKKVLYYLKRYNILVTNSFNEGDKGRAKGKIAGQYSQGNRVLDAELGSSIGYLIQILELIDNMIERTTGVTNQRLGAISTRELVGNVERSRTQSSLITQIWFSRYEQIILDLYDTIIEVAKRAIDTDDRLQFVLDDTSYAMVSDGISDFKNTKFGLFPVNSRNYNKLRGVLEQLAINAIPNGTMSISQLVSLYSSNSLPEMADKQVQFEKQANKLKEEIEKARQEAKMKEVEAAKQYEIEMKKLEQSFNIELEKIKGEYKILIEKMKLQDKAIGEHVKMLNDLNIEKLKMENDKEKFKKGIELESQKLNSAVENRQK